MTKQQMEELVSTKTYDFLRTNPHLKDKIMFLTLGGSQAYGTNVEGSDIDIRGVALNSVDDLVGLTTFDQFVNEETDTTIYSFNKFIRLVADSNPNVVEMLFCNPDNYIWVSPLGQLLLDNRNMFLTQRSFYTFGGYANAQLNRLENALCRNHKIDKEEHIARSLENTIKSFSSRYETFGNDNYIKLHLDNVDDQGNHYITLDMKLNNYPIRDARAMLSDMESVVRDYDKSAGWRNTKKDDAHLNKHMMHLIRLYDMSVEILTTGTLHTYRTEDHGVLMDIRAGKYRNEDGTVKKEFYDLLHKLEDELGKAKDNCKLPLRVDFNKLQEFVVMINKKMLGDIYG